MFGEAEKGNNRSFAYSGKAAAGLTSNLRSYLTKLQFSNFANSLLHKIQDGQNKQLYISVEAKAKVHRKDRGA